MQKLRQQSLTLMTSKLGIEAELSPACFVAGIVEAVCAGPNMLISYFGVRALSSEG